MTVDWRQTGIQKDIGNPISVRMEFVYGAFDVGTRMHDCSPLAFAGRVVNACKHRQYQVLCYFNQLGELANHLQVRLILHKLSLLSAVWASRVFQA